MLSLSSFLLITVRVKTGCSGQTETPKTATSHPGRNTGYSLKSKGFRMTNCIIKIGKSQDLRYSISSLFFIDFLYAKRLFIENGWQ
jgi:hypothetical protein